MGVSPDPSRARIKQFATDLSDDAVRAFTVVCRRSYQPSCTKRAQALIRACLPRIPGEPNVRDLQARNDELVRINVRLAAAINRLLPRVVHGPGDAPV